LKEDKVCPRPQRRSSTSDLNRRIVTAAWVQIAREGAAALSLRAIARSLKIAAPSIYNYFPDRDNLVTSLIVEAFNSMADFLQNAIISIPETNHAERLRGLGMAYHQWAVTYPERYQLVFGTPIAGYTAPTEITIPAAGRSLAILVEVLKSAHSAGKLRLRIPVPATSGLASMLNEWQRMRAPDVDREVLYMALSIWVHFHGMISLEIGNLFPPFIHEPIEVYRRELNIYVEQFVAI
jgi:AcrR family transcriptional regulator